MDKRISIIFIFISIWFSIVALRLWQLQIIDYKHYAELSRSNRIRIVRIPAGRGRIYDRNSILLADNRAATRLAVIANEIQDKKKLVKDLSSITGLQPEYILKKIKDSLYKPFIPAILAEDMTEDMLVKVSEARPILPGVLIQICPVRDYLFGKSMSHLIGYVGKIRQEELSQGYSINSIIGRSGIEKSYDSILQGKDGHKKLQVDNRGNINKILNLVEPEAGTDLHLTIDSRIQNTLYTAIGKRTGAGIVMDPQTGEILAIVSRPGFSPNDFVSPVKEREIAKLFHNKLRPMLNRAIQGRYPPGSIFKIITALAALEKGTINSHTLFYCNGKFHLKDRIFRCWNKHGWIDLAHALEKSCNIYFYNTGLKTGKAAIVNMARRFGLGGLTGIRLPDEKKGFLPDKNTRWHSGDTLNLSIGQGYILVTPIQMASLISAVANGGIYYKPKLVIGEKNNYRKIDIDKKYLNLVKDGLLRVVREPKGTGHKAYIKGLDIAGKTGTAKLQTGKKLTWFIGFAPYASPHIAVCILIENGESGGETAAPIARKAFEKWKQIYCGKNPEGQNLTISKNHI